jgi:hypothetical protein
VTSGPYGSRIPWEKVIVPRDPPGEVSWETTCRVCVARDSNVEKDFSRLYDCPRDRIHVVSKVVTRGALIPTVPADVAADPERLAVWNHDHIGYAYFDVTGCGNRLEYRCILVGGGRRTCSGGEEDRELDGLSSQERVMRNGTGVGLEPAAQSTIPVERVDSGT